MFRLREELLIDLPGSCAVQFL